ncbi:MAG: hypothetical protein APF76_12150 [Desulfitibacter sp. BRH_c19]|nr:MAG: hypothetical protein APF76_12150 [Desulfitibacter sp. BRH_c19]
MSSVIIACETIQDEVMKAIFETGTKFPVIWIESGLHNYPEILRDKLQDQINKIANVDEIYLAFGYCGNSLLGVHSEKAKLIIPKVDDCISLLLGSCKIREDLAQEAGTYFLTRGWIEHENNIIKEYNRCIEKYGKEKATKVIKMMLEHYKCLVLIDTGAYLTKDYLHYSHSFASSFGLEHKIVHGSISFLKRLFTGPWDENFIILQPGEVINIEYFRNVVDPESKLSQL